MTDERKFRAALRRAEAGLGSDVAAKLRSDAAALGMRSEEDRAARTAHRGADEPFSSLIDVAINSLTERGAEPVRWDIGLSRTDKQHNEQLLRRAVGPKRKAVPAPRRNQLGVPKWKAPMSAWPFAFPKPEPVSRLDGRTWTLLLWVDEERRWMLPAQGLNDLDAMFEPPPYWYSAAPLAVPEWSDRSGGGRDERRPGPWWRFEMRNNELFLTGRVDEFGADGLTYGELIAQVSAEQAMADAVATYLAWRQR